MNCVVSNVVQNNLYSLTACCSIMFL